MECVLAAIGILVTVIVAYFAIPEFRKYIPFSSKPLLKICYQKQYLNPSTTIITISIENNGSAPANYLTAYIEAESLSQCFVTKGSKAEFDISISGNRGNMATISAQNILPQQHGAVFLESDSPEIKIKPPKIKSDARYKFIGQLEIKIGKAESYEEYKNKIS